MSDQYKLQHQSELADARMGVAENFGWSMSFLGAIVAQLMWENWVLTISIFIAIYFLITFKYRREAEKAEDAYYRIAGLGKYARQKIGEDG